MATPETNNPAPIEADPELDRSDADSAFSANSSLGESTESITSSLLEYRNIHGRTYQTSKTTEYWAPNDDTHLEAFDLGHHWTTMLMGDKLFNAPIGDTPQKIMDVGTGTGIWAIDVADQFPSAEVIGIDITPTQPGWVPPNLRFEIEDAQLDWTFEPESFDYIHLRTLHGAISDWPKLYSEVFKALKPGGWFEHTEPDIEMRSENPDLKVDEDHIFKQWCQLFYDAGDIIGRTFRLSDQMGAWGPEAGFINVKHRLDKAPLCPWPKDKRLKEIGAYCGASMDLGIDGLVIFPIGQILGWSMDEVQALAAKMRHAIKNPRTRAVLPMHTWYGQKPKKASSAE